MKTSHLIHICSGLMLAGCGRQETPADPTAVAKAPPIQSAITLPDEPPAPTRPPTVEERIVEWKMGPDQIKEEFTTDRRVVRTRRPPEGGVAPDHNMGAQIQARLDADPAFHDAHITAFTDRVVASLTGTVTTLDQVGRAMAIALDTDGISQVVSQLTFPPPPVDPNLTTSPDP